MVHFQFNPIKTELNAPHYILEEPILDFRYVKLYDVDIPEEKWLNYFICKQGDTDQTPHSVVSDMGMHCLLVTRLEVSSLQCLLHP